MSAGWQRIRLNSYEFHGGEILWIRGAFMDIYFAKGGPKGMALLVANDIDAFGDRLVYFTPSAVRHAGVLLTAYAGKPCKPPRITEVELVFGDPENWNETALAL